MKLTDEMRIVEALQTIHKNKLAFYLKHKKIHTTKICIEDINKIIILANQISG